MSCESTAQTFSTFIFAFARFAIRSAAVSIPNSNAENK